MSASKKAVAKAAENLKLAKRAMEHAARELRYAIFCMGEARKAIARGDADDALSHVWAACWSRYIARDYRAYAARISPREGRA